MNRLSHKPIVLTAAETDQLASVIEGKVKRLPVGWFQAGTDGREIELNVSDTYLRWRYLGDQTWTNLIPLSALAGPPGQDGQDGQPGTDGREVEFSYNAENLLWRYVGDQDWQILFDFSQFLTEADIPSIELPSIELPSIELPSQEIIIEPNHIVVTDSDNNITSVLLDSEEVPEIGRQIIIEKDLVEKKYTISLDETKVDHNNLLNWEEDRHRKMNFDENIKAYLIEN